MLSMCLLLLLLKLRCVELQSRLALSPFLLTLVVLLGPGYIAAATLLGATAAGTAAGTAAAAAAATAAAALMGTTAATTAADAVIPSLV